MLVIPRQDQIEIEWVENDLHVTQIDRDGEEHVFFVAMQNVPTFISALQKALNEWKPKKK